MQKKALAKAIKEMGTSGVNVARIKTMMPLLVLMTQIVNVQGLSLAAPLLMLGNEDDVASWVATAAVGFLVWFLVAWLPSLCYRGLKWFLEKLFRRAATTDAAAGPDLPDEPVTHTASTQANRLTSRGDMKPARRTGSLLRSAFGGALTWSKCTVKGAGKWKLAAELCEK